MPALPCFLGLPEMDGERRISDAEHRSHSRSPEVQDSNPTLTLRPSKPELPDGP